MLNFRTTDKVMKLKLREQIIEAMETERVKFHETSFNPEAFASAIVDAVIAYVRVILNLYAKKLKP